jgi:heat shock protein HslJ
MKTVLKSILICILFTVMSCEDTKNSTPSGDYHLDMLNNNAIQDAITLTFDAANNKISGNSGCNSYFGNYTITDSQISFKGMVSTKMACPPEKMKLEQEFLTAISTVESYIIKNNKLSLLNNNGDVVIISEIKED